VDGSGKVVLSGRDFVWQTSIHQIDGLSEFANTILSSDTASVEFLRNGETVFLNSRLIENVGWRLIVEQTTDSVHEPIYMTLLGNIFVTLLLTAIVLIFAHLILKNYQSRLENLATHDALTGALNRRAFDVVLEQTLAEAKRKKDEPFTIAILDIDHFKAVNDTFGHLIGDEVLKDLVACTKDRIRESDVFCRWGGEEFMLLLQNCDITAAQTLVEDIRQIIESQMFEYQGKKVQITVSAGLSQFDQTMNRDTLIKTADEMLYRAKASGRNRVMPTSKAA